MSHDTSQASVEAEPVPIIEEPCEDCGHSSMHHYGAAPYPCDIEDCYCPAWRDPGFTPRSARPSHFPDDVYLDS